MVHTCFNNPDFCLISAEETEKALSTMEYCPSGTGQSLGISMMDNRFAYSRPQLLGQRLVFLLKKQNMKGGGEGGKRLGKRTFTCRRGGREKDSKVPFCGVEDRLAAGETSSRNG